MSLNREQGVKDAQLSGLPRPPLGAGDIEKIRPPCHESRWSSENVSVSHCRKLAGGVSIARQLQNEARTTRRTDR